ncbi:methyl-accepting chemotaxis protein [Massilia consociata]|uniref:Methyl-accepting chemotaxis protein n=1 Tax=Massilia consociata TaxID=760117 RepID=A0ABV6FD01_9BURK
MKFFSDLKIGTRLGSAFAAILVLMAVMLASALWQLARIDEAKSVMAETNHKSKLADDWLEGIATNSVRTLAKVKSTDAADEQYYDDEMKAVSARVSEVQKELASLVSSEQGKALMQAVAEQRQRYAAIRDEAFRRKAELGAGHEELKAFVNDKLLPEMKRYVGAVEEVAAYQKQLFDAADASIDALQASAKRLLIAIGLVALACGATFGWLLTRSITRPLARAVELARQVASGDLTAEIQVSTRDEVGQLLSALKRMNACLLATVHEVRAGTETIVTASQQIASGNLDLSSRTEQQASALEETASSMEELTSSVRQNADNARQANTLAQSASEIAVRGGAVVSQVVTTMASINESSKKIGDIIAVIDGIAFQTNILALNAAVEAARAGEQGRGFAVVASEVRNLAQRSAGAAKEIRGLITDSVAKVDAGGRLVDEAGATMQEIVQGITRVTDVMAEITSASAEQALGIEQVNAAITQMDDVTQQNAALVEEAAAAAASMQDQAASLAQLVSTFKVDGAAQGRRDSAQASSLHAGPRAGQLALASA